MHGLRSTLLWALATSSACSIDFSPQPCNVDGDCGAGLACEPRGDRAVCLVAADSPIVVGQSAPVSGPNQALGIGMKLGIELAMKEQNAAGGIRGRPLQLQFRDDAYQPELAEQATRALVDVEVTADQPPRCPSTAAQVAGAAPISRTALNRGPAAVLAILGNVGTPTMVRAAPIAVETGTVFFGAFTGASTLLRDAAAGPCSRYIFNVRASYRHEAQATVEYFKKRGITRSSNLISFDQLDSFGQSGYDGLVAAYQATNGPFPADADPTTPIFRVRYVRNDDASVPAQVVATEAYIDQLLLDQPGEVTVGILMTDTYGAGASFIEALRTWQWGDDPGQIYLMRSTRLKLVFSNLSFVGPDALAERLAAAGKVPRAGDRSFTEDVMVSQVVPNYQRDTSEVVTAYRALIAQAGTAPSFTSLEGYIAARVFIAGLARHAGLFTPDAIVDALEQLPDLGLGLGPTAGFSSTNHQYSSSVWGTALQADGSFKNLYFWSAGLPIQFFE